MIIKSSFSFTWSSPKFFNMEDWKGGRVRFLPTNSEPYRITTVKPYGSHQAMLGASSGIHPTENVPWVRRTRIGGEQAKIHLEKNRYSHHNHPTAMDSPVVDYMDRLVDARDNDKAKLLEHQWEAIRTMMREKQIVVTANGKPIITATQGTP